MMRSIIAAQSDAGIIAAQGGYIRAIGAYSLHRVNKSEPSEHNRCTLCSDYGRGMLKVQGGFLESGFCDHSPRAGAGRTESLHRVQCFAAEHNHCTGCNDYSLRSRIAAQGAMIIAWVGYTRIDPDVMAGGSERG